MSYYKKYVKSRFKNVNKFLNRKLANLGFISKRKVAISIAKLYLELEERARELDDRTNLERQIEFRKQNWYAQSVLNNLCANLKIKPMHRNELDGGTGEIY